MCSGGSLFVEQCFVDNVLGTASFFGHARVKKEGLTFART